MLGKGILQLNQYIVYIGLTFINMIIWYNKLWLFIRIYNICVIVFINMIIKRKNKNEQRRRNWKWNKNSELRMEISSVLNKHITIVYLFLVTMSSKFYSQRKESTLNHSK